MDENTQGQTAAPSASLSLEHMRQLCDLEEEMGYDAPFITFTWNHWLEIQAIFQPGLLRFQRAIMQRQPAHAALVVLEMQQALFDLYKEAIGWMTTPGKSEGR